LPVPRDPLKTMATPAITARMASQVLAWMSSLRMNLVNMAANMGAVLKIRTELATWVFRMEMTNPVLVTPKSIPEARAALPWVFISHKGSFLQSQ